MGKEEEEEEEQTRRSSVDSFELFLLLWNESREHLLSDSFDA